MRRLRQEIIQRELARDEGDPEPVPALPATEARGGIRPDWDGAQAGGELPQLPDPELHDPPAGG
jgi:hypothetical protein